MLFWIIAALMTAAVTIAAIWPLFRTDGAEAASRAEHDVEVYSAQLDELDADLRRGMIAPGEAETARAEIGRRLLRASGRSKADGGASAPEAGWHRSMLVSAIAGIAILVPITSAAFYTGLGADGLPDEPLAERRAALASGQGPASTNGAIANGGGEATGAPPSSDVTTLVSQAEARLKDHPDDGKGWDVLAPIYLRMERNDDAVNAYRKAIDILGATASREGGLGEALTQQAGGEITDPAKQAFQRALRINENYLPARFFLALDLSQEGENAGAEKAWSQLIAMSSDDAPWLGIARSALADARSKLGEGPAVASNRTDGPSAPAAQQPGPNAAEVEAASKLPDADRQSMIEGMVAQLAARLQSDPNDIEGWKRLIRSYTVLGQEGKAREAFRTASSAFDADTAAGREIAAFGAQIGVSGKEEAGSR